VDVAPQDDIDSSSAPDVNDARIDAADGSDKLCQHPPITVSCAPLPGGRNSGCVIPAGCFEMGSPASELCREQCLWEPSCAKETLHQVELTHSFELLQKEVTQGSFLHQLGFNPSTFVGDALPVNQVTWHEAVAYCNGLSVEAGLPLCYSNIAPPKSCATPSDCDSPSTCIKGQCALFAGAQKDIYRCAGYRLPTEAEWEYSYRAGATTAFYSGSITGCDDDPVADQIGWMKHNASGKPHQGGKKQANAWLLFDMAGNVYEWCHDHYAQDLGSTAVVDPMIDNGSEDRVLRGGCFSTTDAFGSARTLRAAHRHHRPTDIRRNGIGFRCARTLLQ
jgi:formylglycine-generating enzyme required for sulfatase activity